jgi:hypothetical protein
MLRALPPILLTLMAAGPPAYAQSAPPLTELRIVAVISATQSERIVPRQRETARHHDGPVTLVVRQRGIGRARLLRVDGVVTAPSSTSRGLCGAAVTPGACKPGEPLTGVEVIYHLGGLPRGTVVAVQDTSANLPALTLSTEIVVN